MERRLKTFLEVARRGSLTAAAESLHMTQPSLSKRLRLLEEEYGYPLMERGVHGAILTAAGKVLLEHAERIETEYLRSREAVAASGGADLPLIRIGAGPLFHLRYLADALLALHQSHPETRVELVAGLYRETMPQLTGRTLDTNLSSSPSPLSSRASLCAAVIRPWDVARLRPRGCTISIG